MTAYSTDGRFNRATHRVMGYIQDGMDLDAAVYKAAMDCGLGLMDLGKLGREAREQIPKLIENGELIVAKDAYQRNTDECRHLPLKQRYQEAQERQSEAFDGNAEFFKTLGVTLR